MSIFSNLSMNVTRFFSVFIVSVLFGVFFGHADAQTWRADQPASCDVEFADVLEARAEMEAMREIEIARTLILRPDSVLEYSCFDDRLNELALGADIMFSDHVFSPDLFNIPAVGYERPGRDYDEFLPEIGPDGIIRAPGNAEGRLRTGPNPPPFPPGRLFNSGLNDALTNLVYDTMFQFLLSNFSQVYLAGTFVQGGFTPGVCNPMDLVWEFVKCTNFDKGLFRTFIQLALLDPRVDAIPCNVPGRSAMWADNIITANPPPGEPGAIDILPIEPPTIVQLLTSTNCEIFEPIPTGLTVFWEGGQHRDYVCPAPSCFYYRGRSERQAQAATANSAAVSAQTAVPAICLGEAPEDDWTPSPPSPPNP